MLEALALHIVTDVVEFLAANMLPKLDETLTILLDTLDAKGKGWV